MDKEKKEGWWEKKRKEWSLESRFHERAKKDGAIMNFGRRFRARAMAVLSWRYGPVIEEKTPEDPLEAATADLETEPDFGTLRAEYTSALAQLRTDETRPFDLELAQNAIIDLRSFNQRFSKKAHGMIDEVMKLIFIEVKALAETMKELTEEKIALEIDKKAAISDEERLEYEALDGRLERLLRETARSALKIKFVVATFDAMKKSLHEVLTAGFKDLSEAEKEIARRETLDRHSETIDQLAARVAEHSFFADVQLPMQLATKLERLRKIFDAFAERHETRGLPLGEALFETTHPLVQGIRDAAAVNAEGGKIKPPNGHSADFVLGHVKKLRASVGKLLPEDDTSALAILETDDVIDPDEARNHLQRLLAQRAEKKAGEKK